MLSDRERRTLARIEQQLVASDPEFARLFRPPAVRPPRSLTPTFLLVAGLALLVLGSLVAAVPVAVAGMVLSIFALFTTHTRPSMIPRADPA